MNVKLGLCLMGGMLMLPAAYACDVLPTSALFFFYNDTNQDKVIDAVEWKRAQMPAND